MTQNIYASEESLRRRGFVNIAGVDEAGRGACAGPLVAAAVILPSDARIDGLGDSKALTAKSRDLLFEEIHRVSLATAVAVISAAQIDACGIQPSNIAALRRACLSLVPLPDYVLIDGFHIDGLPSPSLAMWKGDAAVACVAAASIVAKVTRDRLMDEMDSVYPGYEFARHKGYSTAVHTRALRALGPCLEHRHTYANVRAAAGVVVSRSS